MTAIKSSRNSAPNLKTSNKLSWFWNESQRGKVADVEDHQLG